jgi:hypothetical protein
VALAVGAALVGAAGETAAVGATDATEIPSTVNCVEAIESSITASRPVGETAVTACAPGATAGTVNVTRSAPRPFTLTLSIPAGAPSNSTCTNVREENPSPVMVILDPGVPCWGEAASVAPDASAARKGRMTPRPTMSMRPVASQSRTELEGGLTGGAWVSTCH